MNLVELILKQLLSGDLLGSLASGLGASAEDTKKAVNASVPALLSGIGSVVSKPDGADKLWNALRQVDDSVVSDYGDMLTGDKHEELAKSGTSLLELLFGKNMLGSLIGALGRFLGGKNELVTKLLPMLAPMLLGMIGRQVKSGGLDLAGLVRMIAGQKGNVAAAMPHGLLNSLSAAQGLGDLAGYAKGAAGAVGSASRAATAATAEAVSPLKWLVPLLLVAAVLIGGYWWMNRPSKVAPEDLPGLAAPGAAETVGIDVAELTNEFTSLFDKFGQTLESVTDAASAEAALPELQKMDGQIDLLQGTLAALSETARPEVTQMIEASTKTLQDQADKVLALPGVGDVLKSVIDGIIQKLMALVTG